MKKRLSALILSVVMCMSLAGCGGEVKKDVFESKLSQVGLESVPSVCGSVAELDEGRFYFDKDSDSDTGKQTFVDVYGFEPGDYHLMSMYFEMSGDVNVAKSAAEAYSAYLEGKGYTDVSSDKSSDDYYKTYSDGESTVVSVSVGGPYSGDYEKYKDGKYNGKYSVDIYVRSSKLTK